jgi:hypothetical protein
VEIATIAVVVASSAEGAHLVGAAAVAVLTAQLLPPVPPDLLCSVLLTSPPLGKLSAVGWLVV